MNGETSNLHRCSCAHQYESGRTARWTGTWRIYDQRADTMELDISGRGSGFRVILGESSTGKYLFIPCLERGCVLSWDLQDYCWNLGHLSRQINTTDAVTIISAVRDLGAYLLSSEEDERADVTEENVTERRNSDGSADCDWP